MKSSFKFSHRKWIFISTILFFYTFGWTQIHSEEYSIRKKKVLKKQESTPKAEAAPIGYSRDNNKLSNQFWLEEGAMFSPDSLFQSATEEIPSTEPNSIGTQTPATEIKPTDDTPKTIEKPVSSAPQKPNIVLQFLNENKKVLLIIALIVIFAVYRLRGDSSSYKNQNTRIFSKFRNK